MCDVIELVTQNNLQYVFFPVSASAIKFKVKASNDAHVALTIGNYECNPMTEIHIGGWGNTKTVVRRDGTQPNKVEELTPGLLNGNEYVSMWIRWYGGCIAAGLQGSDVPFISYQDPSPYGIDHMAVRTGWGASGSWKIEVSPAFLRMPRSKLITEGELRWFEMSSGDAIPTDAVVGGFEDGELIYIAKARHNDAIGLGKYVPSTSCASVSCQTQLIKKEKFEILRGFNCLWYQTKGNLIPPNAFRAATADETGLEDLFIGKVLKKDDIIPGHVQVQHKSCYISFKEEMVRVKSYRLLLAAGKTPKQIMWRPPLNISSQSAPDILPRNVRRPQRRVGGPRVILL